MDESDARRVLLAQAIETTDGEGRVLSVADRDQVDLQARQEAMQRTDALSADEFVALRAQHLLARVAVHHPQLAALQERRAWQTSLEWVVPLAALVIGIATDAIGNPHRVDLVSLPLLGIVVWNLAIYAVLFASMFRGGTKKSNRGERSWFGGFGGIGRWGRNADASTQASARFHMDWFRATQSLHMARIARVLHLSAAAWALGVILSLLVRGLVVEYRVGWESTFLGPQQVYEILRVVRVPALLVFPFDTFSVNDVAQMRFSDGGGAQFGAPWVWMYVALLITVVILPRLLLATWAAWKETLASRAIPLDLKAPYFERIAGMLDSTRVRLGLLAHRNEDRERFLRIVAPEREALPILVSSPVGDVLRLVDLPRELPPAPETKPGWWDRMRASLGRETPKREARDECDVVVHLVSDHI
jgi:hypothetical protein